VLSRHGSAGAATCTLFHRASLVPGLGTLCYAPPVLKGEDIIVLLRLAEDRAPATVRALEAELGIARSVIHRSIGRLLEARLLDPGEGRVNLSRSEELLVHAVKYMFPAARGGETRGIPTAWAAPPLQGRLAPSDELPPVWPDPTGDVRGIALEPLHPSATGIARADPPLAEELALIDALRIGDPRVAGRASDLLRERLTGAHAAS
jgi:hypothetical protein